MELNPPPLLKSGIVGQEGLAHNQRLSWVEFRALCRPLELLHNKLVKPCLRTWGTVMQKQEWVLPNVESVKFSKIPLYAIKLPFTGAKGPKP